MNSAQILYGQNGQPVGSIEGDALFDKAGQQIGYLAEDYIYLRETGERAGCYAGGIVYNSRGAPQAFTDGCCKTLLPMEPRLAPVSPRLGKVGKDVSSLPTKPIPTFLRQDTLTNERDRLLDGQFL